MNIAIRLFLGYLWSPPVQRVMLAFLGGFFVALSMTGALSLIFVAEGMESLSDAFYWSSFITFFVYVGAMIWAFAAPRMLPVVLTFCGSILVSATIVAVLGGDGTFGYGVGLHQAILLVLILTALWFGFAALAMAQNKHWQTVTNQRICPPVTARALQGFGWSLLTASLLITLVREGLAFGLLLWPMIAFAVGLAVAFAIAYRPSLIQGFAIEAYNLTTDKPLSVAHEG